MNLTLGADETVGTFSLTPFRLSDLSANQVYTVDRRFGLTIRTRLRLCGPTPTGPLAPALMRACKSTGGHWYAPTFDRPHNLTIATQWKWSRGWTFGTNFVYTSGRPITYPDGTYRLNGAKAFNYSQRNVDRIPDYQRLDVSFTKDGRRTPDQWHYSNWSISLYNVYARKNPYLIYFQRVNTTTKSYQLSVFGTVIPSLSWNFTF